MGSTLFRDPQARSSALAASCGKIWEYVKWPTNLQRCSVSELNDHNIIHADNLDYVHVI